MLKTKIAFIGPGAMAEAMIAGLLREKLAAPRNLLASGPRTERVETAAARSTASSLSRITAWPSRRRTWSCSRSNPSG